MVKHNILIGSKDGTVLGGKLEIVLLSVSNVRYLLMAVRKG